MAVQPFACMINGTGAGQNAFSDDVRWDRCAAPIASPALAKQAQPLPHLATSRDRARLFPVHVAACAIQGQAVVRQFQRPGGHPALRAHQSYRPKLLLSKGLFGRAGELALHSALPLVVEKPKGAAF